MAAAKPPQEFIRALKSPRDPPEIGGPTKILIACSGWSDSSLQFANKAEVICDFVLSRFLKDKGNVAEESSLLDARYWNLICDILVPRDEEASSGLAPHQAYVGRPPEAWLAPLLARIPLAPIISTFLNLVKDAAATPASVYPITRLNELLSLATRFMELTWPLAAPKFTTDAFLECFGSFLALRALSTRDSLGTESRLDFIRLGRILIASFRYSFDNLSNKKKVSVNFLRQHFAHWLACSTDIISSHGLYSEEVFQAGAAALFNADTLKDTNFFDTVIESLKSTVLSKSQFIENLPLSISPYAEVLVRSIPRLFTSYIRAIREYRVVINGGDGAAIADRDAVARTSAVLFMEKCHTILVDLEEDCQRCSNSSDATMDTDDDLRVDIRRGQHRDATANNGTRVRTAQASWQTRVDLFHIFESSDLFRVSDPLPTVLSACAGLATSTLEDSSTVADIQDHVAEALAVLVRIDFDIVKPYLGRIVTWLALTASSHSMDHPGHQLLHYLLEYHIKTRSLPAYIETLFAALSSASCSSLSTSVSAYRQTCASLLMSYQHMGRLSDAISRFLTAGQVQDTLTMTVTRIHDSWDTFLVTSTIDDAESPRKRKNRNVGSIQNLSFNSAVTSLALHARIASVVLSSLPFQLTQMANRLELFSELDQFRSSIIQPATRKALKLSALTRKAHASNQASDALRTAPGSDMSLVWHIAAATMLRLDYTLAAAARRYSSKFNWELNPEPKNVAKLLGLVDHGGSHILPELALEAFRYLFALVEDGGLEQSESVISHCLRYIQQHYTMDQQQRWSGLACDLVSTDGGRHCAAMALLHHLLDRRLPVLEQLASSDQLRLLVDTVISTCEARGPPILPTRDWLGHPAITSNALRTGQWWELPRLRVALLDCLGEYSAVFDQSTPPHEEGSLAFQPTTEKLGATVTAFELLLVCPADYMARAHRLSFLHRAIHADAFCVDAAHNIGDKVSRFMLILRTFIVRTLKTMQPSEFVFPSDVVSNLLEFDDSNPAMADLENTTTGILRFHIQTTLHNAQKGEPEQLEDLLRHLIAKKMSKVFGFKSGTGDVIQKKYSWRQKTVLLFLTVVTAESTASDFSEGVRAELRQLHQALLSALEPQLRTMTLQGSDHRVLVLRPLAQAWLHNLVLEKWLGEDTAQDFHMAPTLVRKVLDPSMAAQRKEHGDSSAKLFALILSIAAQEALSRSDELRESRLEMFIASYVALSTACGDDGNSDLDAALAESCKRLTKDDFTFVTTSVAHSLDDSAERCAHFVRLTTILMREAPEGTLKSAQSHMEICLEIFTARWETWLGSRSASLPFLRLLSEHCTTRPAYLRPQDLAIIWSLLPKLLVGSEIHHPNTCAQIFSEIVNVLGAIVRLRRDLISATLPHLGFVLRQLLMVLRSPRPGLGPRQTKLVTDTLPVWINAPAAVLGATEAAALARLLTSLTTKTTPRIFTSSAHAQTKAESLQRPFARHAAYVLKAYADAANDPLCVLPLEIRRELKPGLFSLCEMTSESSRDALIVSELDAGGTAILKNIWKEYEKQRYVGKG